VQLVRRAADLEKQVCASQSLFSEVGQSVRRSHLLIDGDSQQLFQVLSAQLSFAQDAFQDLWVEGLRGVKWNRGPLPAAFL